jgi:hypothetical protein
MATLTYDPKKNIAVLAGITLNLGIAPDTFLEFEFDEDAFTKQVGAGGEVTRVVSRNKGASCKVTLMASSQVNDALSALYNSDRLLGNGIGEFMLKEVNGTTLIHAAEAWVKRLPNVDRAKDAGTVQWEIDIASAEGIVGGLITN